MAFGHRVKLAADKRSRGKEWSRFLLEIEICRGENGWIDGPASWSFPFDFPEIIELGPKIEKIARITNRTGPHRLWEGYEQVQGYPNALGRLRTPDQVRTTASVGMVFAWLAAARESGAIIEIGTGFGVSGMYWLAGLRPGGGHLHTFEANAAWAGMAKNNLAAISPHFTLTEGVFEDSADAALKGVRADVALVDGIHDGVIVRRQMETLRRFLAPDAIVVLADINFSKDMARCWEELRDDPDFSVSATIGPRIGLVELAGDA